RSDVAPSGTRTDDRSRTPTGRCRRCPGGRQRESRRASDEEDDRSGARCFAWRSSYSSQRLPVGFTELTVNCLMSTSLFVSFTGVPVVPLAGFCSTAPPLLVTSVSARNVPDTSTFWPTYSRRFNL